jgi:aspartate-semialdehyde dehydrogenase
MSVARHSRIVIAGASSLLGSELKTLLEESRFAGWDVHLVDEEEVAGTLTEAGGEATLIQRVETDTFHAARFVFLACSHSFGKQCLGPARQAGATVIDFSGASLSDPDATPWFSKIETLSGRRATKNSKTFSVFSAGATGVATLVLALGRFGIRRLFAVLHQPVSDAGRKGIEELETQTSQLLSFQNIGHGVFGTQAAFNLLPRYGAESHEDLYGHLLQIRSEVSAAVGDATEAAKISLNLIHAPVFYGTTFSACADLEKELDAEVLSSVCRAAGFVLTRNGEAPPSNVSVAGETSLHLTEPIQDSSRAGSWWFWCAGDNLRVPAWGGVQLAEWLDT